MSGEDHFWFRPLRDVHRCGWSPAAHVEETLRRLAAASHRRETGGLLLGWWDGSVPTVVDAIEVPDPTATGNRWTRQPEAAHTALAEARAHANPLVGYVGDWHSHPANVGASPRDISQIRQDSRGYPNALALVVVRFGGNLDTRLALRGRLTTLTRLGAAR